MPFADGGLLALIGLPLEVDVNPATLTCWGYYRISNIGLSCEHIL